MRVAVIGLCLILVAAKYAHAQVRIDDPEFTRLLGKELEVYLEDGHMATPDMVLADTARWQPLSTAVVSIMDDDRTYWVRIGPILNASGDRVLLKIANPLLDSIFLYRLAQHPREIYRAGSQYPYMQRSYNSGEFLADLELEQGTTGTYLLRMCSQERIVVPISVGTERGILSEQGKQDMFLGLFFGIMLVIVLYNFSLFWMTKERSYLFYVLYIFFFSLTQASFTGYSFRFVLYEFPVLFNQSLTIFAGMSGIFGIYFAREFLHIRHFTPRLNKGLNLFLAGYVCAILLSVANLRHLAFAFIDFTGLFLSLYGFVFGIVIARKGYRPAKFFLVAWSIFLVGLVLFVLRNLGILPHSFMSNYTLQIGAALEAILFSVALADKINILKEEKEESQARELALAQENERIQRDAIIELDAKVKERTRDLAEANENLKETLKALKDAQGQLVNAEKMASLGQLTAGIAHEINNPINFVSSNIRPLRRDIEDLLSIIRAYEDRTGYWSPEQVAEMEAIKKQLDFGYLQEELQVLISGMEEGANRTAEIVKGLRIFSRVDEADLKKADINEGIDSTLILLNSSMGGKITVEKDYAEQAVIECYPGKLNQVFMNLLTNAIQAIQSDPSDTGKGLLTIKTRHTEDGLEIRIRDNGPGMTEEVKNRIFEPFYTTKRVGQGTGLGLSIVYSIIESHRGTIRVESEPGQGAEFIIHLPKIHQ